MLKSLNIKNYAIIDNLTIDFEKGFNVFVGETGAGKSIIVGALSFLLKGRSDSSVIKNGKDKAIIEGVFDIDDEEIINQLKDQDIDVDGDLIIKRVISLDNKNSIKINESNVTLTFLTELMSKYVDIHSQKDNHFLFNKRNQLSLLDKYANNEAILKEYSNEFEKYKNLINEYDDLNNNTYNASEIEYYKFDYKELDDANLDPQEENELEEKEKRYKSSEKYIQTLSEAIALYDNNYGIKENLYNLFNGLNLNDEAIDKISSSIQDIYYQLDERIEDLKNILNSFSDADINVEELEERLYLYSKLKRKHKCDVEGLISLKENLRNKILSFEDRDNILAKKQKEIDEQYLVCKKLADCIHSNREVAANKLQDEVCKEAVELLLNNIRFNINFEETELNSLGYDDIEFLVSMNKGEELKPLRNVASGGEISRLMLALKVVFSKLSNTGLLILDEIDSGVSGTVAKAVGEKISKIASDLQVICISHLAPVAACSDSRYLIYKEDINDQTQTNVKQLDEDEFIKQLAIIANTSTDDKALQASRELFDTCQKAINENR